ncbi:hypothetical protein O3V59_07050 [Brevibacillus thermoruber]|uniref:Uncharacterized protein n=1 Tax=Brevibacillus thermoruber TaxID=33942 RepID=A0A9X3TP35_9BACL|nr:hypothetical protein [Brevibacillus thermoruber]MDA5108111.1 hypothetical protein [Brevibacillus thermoruber]
MVQIIFKEFSPLEKQKLARIVLNCVSKGEGETEFDDLKKAFEIAKKTLNKPTSQMCQYVWQEHLRDYYRSVYEKALQKGSINRAMRQKNKLDEENRYFVSLMCTEILKGLTVSQAIESVSKIINLKESTVKTKWYKLIRNDEYRRQYEEALKNKSEYQGQETGQETNEYKQEFPQDNNVDSFEAAPLPDETVFLDTIEKFIISYKNLKKENEEIKLQNKLLHEKSEQINLELERMRSTLKSLL